jgi:hypothetical protein
MYEHIFQQYVTFLKNGASHAMTHHHSPGWWVMTHHSISRGWQVCPHVPWGRSQVCLFLASVVSPVLYSRLMFCKFYNCGKCHFFMVNLCLVSFNSDQGWFMTKFFLHLKLKWKGMLKIHVFNSYNFLFIF